MTAKWVYFLINVKLMLSILKVFKINLWYLVPWCKSSSYQSNFLFVKNTTIGTGGINLVKRTITMKLTCCVFITMFLHCLLSHLKASFHLFTAQHSKEWKLKMNRESILREPFSSKHVQNVTRWLWNLCHFFVQKKRCKGSRGTTTHWVKKQIWTLLNISGPR